MKLNYLSIPIFQRLHVEILQIDKSFHPTLYNGYNYLCMLGLELIYHGKMSHMEATTNCRIATNNANTIQNLLVISYILILIPEGVTIIYICIYLRGLLTHGRPNRMPASLQAFAKTTEIKNKCWYINSDVIVYCYIFSFDNNRHCFKEWVEAG